MFVGSQNFTGSWGSNFVGIKNDAIVWNLIQFKIEMKTCLSGLKLVGKGETWNT
jgi:hypothetical protein